MRASSTSFGVRRSCSYLEGGCLLRAEFAAESFCQTIPLKQSGTPRIARSLTMVGVQSNGTHARGSEAARQMAATML